MKIRRSIVTDILKRFISRGKNIKCEGVYHSITDVCEKLDDVEDAITSLETAVSFISLYLQNN